MKQLFILIIFLLGCSKHKNSDVIAEKFYSYGTEPLPVTLLPLDSSYRPDKLQKKNFLQYVAADFISQNLHMSFDVSGGIISATSTVTFITSQDGRPLFELNTDYAQVYLDGMLVNTIRPENPDNETLHLWSIDQPISDRLEHILVIIYTLPDDRATFINGGVRFLTQMTDLNGRFFEHWGPTSFEDDSYTLNLNLKVLNSDSAHELFANGGINKISDYEWKISFPEFYTKSSFYIHLTNAPIFKNTFIYHGQEKEIKVTAYSGSESLTQKAIDILPSLFQEFESDYGPYAHDSFIAYLQPNGGGMEYVGATVSSIGSLDHELFHSWFARSVMPADGRSGWIDEALASWRDYGYFRGNDEQRSPTNLSNFSPFKKNTPRNSYVDGRNLIAELDQEFANYGGMKPIMKVFYERYKNRIITNEEFWNFLTTVTQKNLDGYYFRYTLANMDYMFTN